ncbi:uncharacterized protein FOMMEDRAFT_149822 [Fomitiporia mediterranea MF3/22]|uniref:uncharacterized protein n=1 Tax=Fomitiporia mediterranea (strain MF3/22) TaxID=694068 RepID=UPI0004407695|nr:uncharacterized protein FOMMEDRAFT_149822 [Fomitiporia mediterranea MF3/22]EJD07306.1 hypothetical protein FOMMEDRAFT_149822 [Fomitiporia mediterranea MF3/22]
MTLTSLTFVSSSPRLRPLFVFSVLHACCHHKRMPYRLPIELWTLIIRHAIAPPPIEPDRFNPPLHDFECVSGFAGSSTTFRDIVQVLKDEILVVHFSDIEQISPISVRRAKYLQITSSSLGSDVLDRITGFSQLTSFSVVLLEGPVEFLFRLQSLAMSQTLQSIDIRAQLWAIFNPGEYSKHLLRSSTLSFPKLERLRLSDCDPFSLCEDIIQEQTMRELAAFFSGCRDLQLLTIHIPLGKKDDIAISGICSHAIFAGKVMTTPSSYGRKIWQRVYLRSSSQIFQRSVGWTYGHIITSMRVVNGGSKLPDRGILQN